MKINIPFPTRSEAEKVDFKSLARTLSDACETSGPYYWSAEKKAKFLSLVDVLKAKLPPAPEEPEEPMMPELVETTDKPQEPTWQVRMLPDNVRSAISKEETAIEQGIHSCITAFVPSPGLPRAWMKYLDPRAMLERSREALDRRLSQMKPNLSQIVEGELVGEDDARFWVWIESLIVWWHVKAKTEIDYTMANENYANIVRSIRRAYAFAVHEWEHRTRTPAKTIRRLEKSVFSPLVDSDKVELLPWELLPAGSEGMRQMLNEIHEFCARHPDGHLCPERIEYVCELMPDKWYRGYHNFSDYRAFVFIRSDWVLLESFSLGNAAYIVPKANWQRLSQLAKSQLLLEPSTRRVPHQSECSWKVAIRHALQIVSGQ